MKINRRKLDRPFRVHMFDERYYELVKGSPFDFKDEWTRVRLSVYAAAVKAKRRH